jgi:triacylglycerol lipase
MELSYRVELHNREKSKNKNNNLPLDPPHFDVVHDLNMRPLISQVNIAWFFYSQSLNMIVVVFTGTYNDTLALYDVNYGQKPCGLHNGSDTTLAHDGFLKLYEGVRCELYGWLDRYANNSTQIILTGHSLGGATSTLAALDLQGLRLTTGVTLNKIIHYGFASPRVFNPDGANRFNHHVPISYRVSNGSDIIPQLPFPVMLDNITYQHTGQYIPFDTHLGSNYDNHVTAYLDYYGLTPFTDA